MKQTAVEWLIKELNLEGYDHTIKQAKEMEKQQTEISNEEIEKAADKYVSEDEFNRYLECFEAGAKWYREQLKKKK